MKVFDDIFQFTKVRELRQRKGVENADSGQPVRVAVVGRYVVRELVNAGHGVTSVDILAAKERMPSFLAGRSDRCR